ncbi:MAG TPA: response regulator, partial [Candidatus Limnocylindrales bacterium]|nr:response regulator [Candidatus Limnocylindrales bacterium]
MRNGAPKILVVDDNPPTRYSTGRVLRAARFEVIEAATGGEALQATSQNPDLVILDVNLPDISGFEVCRRLRANPATARTPVVHLSATFVDADAKVQGLDAGADGYLTHPVEPPVLIATVNAFLRARHAEEGMRSSEAKFKAVFENAASGIALLTDGMVFLEVNPAIASSLGRDRADIEGRHLALFLPSGHAQLLSRIDEGLAATGLWRGAFPILDANGREVELEWSVSIHSD